MLSPKFQIGSKSPSPRTPPTKLLINHGKPNYTIPRTKNYNKYHIDETDNTNEVAKIILKKPIIKNNNNININGNNSDKKDNVEFLQKHQKISQKLSVGSNDDIYQQNNFHQVNGECEFLQKHKKIVTNGTNNGNANFYNDLPPIINGDVPICFKPYQLKNKESLAVRTDIKTTDITSENKEKKPQKPEIKQKPLTTPPIYIMHKSSESGPNFEQKTIVSFSRELAQPNKYLDTVKTAEGNPVDQANNDFLMGMAQIKFDIKDDGRDNLVVSPVIR